MMPDTRMRKWKIGLLVLGVVTLGLLVYVMIQGLQSKQDRVTYKQATKIADKLNSYITNNRTVPVSLTAAGIDDVPDNITYTRKGTSKYEFCITYKAANTDVSSQVTQDLYNATSNRGLTNAATEGPSSSYGTGIASYNPETLYIDSIHKAGQQCQTVEPYISSYTYPYVTPNYKTYDNTGTGTTNTQDYSPLSGTKYPTSTYQTN